MNNWKKVKLCDIADVQTGPFGSQLKNKQYITGGTPVVTVEHINDFSIRDFEYPSISEDDKKRLKKYLLKAGDIVFTRVGSVDLSAWVKPHQNGWMFSSRMLRVRTNSETDSKYLAYYFRQNILRQHMLNIAVGATMPSINTSLLKNVPVTIPPLPTQRRIAAILSALDDKIENNRRICNTLEQIAQALFKRWFVDFDFPDTQGRSYKSSGGRMVESELGMIPEGWEVVSLIDAINIYDSKRIPLSKIEREKKKGKIPYYGATGVMDYVDEPIFNGDYLLMAEDGSVMDEKGFPIIQQVWGKFWVNNHAHIFIGNLAPNSYLYFWLKQLNVKEYVTGAVQLKISQSSMKRMIFAYPDNELKNFFDKMFVQIKQLKNEIQVLQQTRDTLLPKLMSGEVEV